MNADFYPGDAGAEEGGESKAKAYWNGAARFSLTRSDAAGPANNRAYPGDAYPERDLSTIPDGRRF